VWLKFMRNKINFEGEYLMEKEETKVELENDCLYY
jgi:hypothetical protein